MSSEIALPTALDELEVRLRQSSPGNLPVISQALRVLQRFGLTRDELTVHVERIRAINEAGIDDPVVEEACLEALDLIAGRGRQSLEWSPRVIATAWLPRALSQEVLAAALPDALSPNDLLPRRSQVEAITHGRAIVEVLWSRLDDRTYSPTPAEIFRAPKSGLTTRPAALLTPQDRLIFEGLSTLVATKLDATTPVQVVWPRGRSVRGNHESFLRQPMEWQSEFVVRTDIESFYEGVDHSILAVVASRTLGLPSTFAVALEAHLGAVMDGPRGLPQGPPGSDFLASAYLLDIDRELSQRGWEFARYSDDYMFGADSVVDARRRLRELEAMLLERGLRLSEAKTRVVRLSTYVRNADTPNPRIEEFRKKLRSAVRERLTQTTDSDEIEEILTAAGADEEIVWDLMYRQEVALDEVIEQLGDQLGPGEAEAYSQFFEAAARRLDQGTYPDQLGATERELRECLLVMSSARRFIDLRLLHAVLDWMPTLVRDITFYLEAVGATRPNEVAKFVADRNLTGRDSDLEGAWLLSSALTSTEIIGALYETLADAAQESKFPLSRSVAVRALAIGGALSQEVWLESLQALPGAIRAELQLARGADVGIFPAQSLEPSSPTDESRDA